MRLLWIFLLTILTSAAYAETVKIKWNGNYPHNSAKIWSRDNPHDSGYSRNFKNGTPQEFDQVQKDGELNAEILLPKDTTGPVPFMLILHSCTGLHDVEKWAHDTAKQLNDQGIGALILDSFTTRYVDMSCGTPDLHWGRRRAEDAFSALDYLVGRKLAKPSEIYVMGRSGGGTTSLVAMTKTMDYHKYRFGAGFPIEPACFSVTLKYGDLL
jgi:dienelactone hydrolase